MRRSYLFVFVSVVVCGIALTEALAQPISYGSCTRQQFESYFETYPGQEKLTVMRFFDNARKVSDNSVKLLVAGQLGELYSSMTPQALSVEKFRDYLANDEQRDGKVLDYKFLGQSLLFSGRSEVDLRESTLLITYYSVRTTKWQDHTYLSMWTRGVKSTPMLQVVELDHYDPEPASKLSENVEWEASRHKPCPKNGGMLKIIP